MKGARAPAFCIASAIALCGCATLQSPTQSARAFAEATPLCVLLENPKPFLGRRLLVRGYLSEDFHSRVFWDKGCEDGSIKLSRSPETARSRRLRSVLDAYSARSMSRQPG